MRIKTGSVDGIYEKALEIFLEEYIENIKKKGRFVVAFSGGSTPVPFFRRLREAKVDWEKILIFQVDERQVPETHDDSNSRMLKKELLDHVNVPEENLFLIGYHAQLEKMAEDYRKKLFKVFKSGEASFDLVFLGIGEDGHTASLFPENVSKKGDVVVYMNPGLGSIKHSRVSLGIEAINRSQKKVFMFKSEGKESVLNEMSRGKHPASHVKGDIGYISD